MGKKAELPSQNDRLRTHLESVKDQVDLKTASGRRRSLEIYLKENPDASPSALPAAHHSVLAKKAKEWGHKPSDYKAGSRGQKKMVDPSIRAKVHATPSGVGEGKEGPNWREGQKPGEHHGKIPNQTAPPPGTTYTPRAAGAVLNCVYNVLRIPRPWADKMDADDREALGEIWAPIFNRYFIGHAYAEVGVACMATLGFFSQKIIDSDGENKAKWEAEQELKKQKHKKNIQESTPEPHAHERKEGEAEGEQSDAAAEAKKRFGRATEGESDF